MSTTISSGTQTCTVGTEHILTTIMGEGAYSVTVADDAAALTTGETLTVRLKMQPGGGTLRPAYVTVLTGPLVTPVCPSVPFVVPSGWRADVTVQQAGGVGRTFRWAVVKL